MKRLLIVVGAALLVAACGGAAAKPTPVTHIDLGTPTAGTHGASQTATAGATASTAADCVYNVALASLVVTIEFPDLDPAECSALSLSNASRADVVPSGAPDCTVDVGGHTARLFGDDAAGDACAGFSGATPTPAAGSPTVALGQAVDITCGGSDCLQIAVDKVQFAKSYRDPTGFLNDTPQTRGDEFMAYYVTYTATGPDASYNPFDWAVYVSDTAVDTFTFVEHGPTPELQSGELPQGKKAGGWIVQEVPSTGRVVIAYQPGASGDIFEVVARSK